uniref:Uncharacterized protein n=1 Tax=Craspedostauros australis TaxID=1486917 RepID=A0A7R9ZQ43_9STRA
MRVWQSVAWWSVFGCAVMGDVTGRVGILCLEVLFFVSIVLFHEGCLLLWLLWLFVVVLSFLFDCWRLSAAWGFLSPILLFSGRGFVGGMEMRDAPAGYAQEAAAANGDDGNVVVGVGMCHAGVNVGVL